jgi:hypothetical protein
MDYIRVEDKNGGAYLPKASPLKAASKDNAIRFRLWKSRKIKPRGS